MVSEIRSVSAWVKLGSGRRSATKREVSGMMGVFCIMIWVILT